ncbi:MAG: hypothetical protein IKN78_13315 [Bacteroidales bacterium]|nr:hypothetical protein [Bacteroidales bacterium]
MKKIFLFALLLSASVASYAQGHWFTGGSANIGFRNYFVASGEVWVGYEFNDWVAMGSGLGAVICAGRDDFFAVTGIAEPFVRASVWHNESVSLDLYALGGFEFTDELKLCQVGLRPSIRFRVSENIEMAVDLVVLGAQYSPEFGWRPSISFTSLNGGARFAYHF